MAVDSGVGAWKPTFAAITDKDLLLYDAAPCSKEDWATPSASHAILATRYLFLSFYLNRLV